MKVFISSVIAGMESYRDQVAAAAGTLGHEVVRAEDFPASPATPQRACLQGVREAGVTVLILGPRYGEPQASGLSATHEEYREARDRCPVIVLVQAGVDREPEQEAFLAEVRDWSQGHYTASFSDPEDLRDEVTRALHELSLAQASGPLDPDEMVGRARELLSDLGDSHEALLAVAVAGGPRQQILRPAEIEAPDFADDLARDATFGPHRILDRSLATETRIEGHSVVLEQRNASVYVDEQGSVRLVVPALSRDPTRPRFDVALIEEDVTDVLERTLCFAADLLDRIDGSHRMTHVAVATTVLGAGYLGWMTRAERAANPNGVSVPLSVNPEPVVLAPPDRPRPALALQPRQLAEDLTVLLRRAREGT